jgi:hypothetical protein
MVKNCVQKNKSFCSCSYNVTGVEVILFVICREVFGVQFVVGRLHGHWRLDGPFGPHIQINILFRPIAYRC